MTTLEHKEIKGITSRIMVLIIGSTISICLSICGLYYGLKTEIQNNATDTKILNMRVTTLEVSVKRLQDNEHPKTNN